MLIQRAKRLTLSISVLCCALGLIQQAEAKRKKKAKKKKVTIEQQYADRARGVYTDQAGSPDLRVRLSITRGLIELGGDDRVQAVQKALVASDTELQALAMDTILKDKRSFKKQVKEAESLLKKMLESSNDDHRALAFKTLKEAFKKKKQIKWLQNVVKSGSAVARVQAGRALIQKGGKIAWKLIKQALALPIDDPLHTLALDEFKSKRYDKAESWAISHAGDDNEDGVVARAWLEDAPKQLLVKMSKSLLKEYYKAGKKGDFVRRVRLAHLLSSRGHLDEVQDTLVVAVKDKQGRIEAHLDTPELRVMGWEGLKNSRDAEALKALKPMILNLQNNIEAIPAVQWLAEWVKDRRDPEALKTLKDLAKHDQYAGRVAAIKAFGTLKLRDKESLGILEQALRNGNNELRVYAAEALSGVAMRGDEKRFEKYLLNRSERKSAVRVALLKGVERMGSAESVPILKYWLVDRDAAIRTAALDALLKVKLNQHGKILNRKLRNDPDVSIRLKVWKALLVNDYKAVEKRLKSTSRWLDPEQVQELANEQKVPSSLFVSLALNSSEKVRSVALSALADRGENEATNLLRVIEQSVEPNTTAQAIELLASLVGVKGMGTYKAKLNDRSSKVRVACLEAYQKYGERSLIEALEIFITNEQEPLARVEAARALVAVSQRAK